MLFIDDGDVLFYLNKFDVNCFECWC